MSNQLTAWVDGSIYPNPGGSAGAAAILIYGNLIRVEGLFIPAPSTNNIAEASAVKLALSCLTTKMPIVVVSDSQYCAMCARRILVKRKLPEKNVELWASMQNLLRKPERVAFVHVHGHQGEPLNEVCDLIAGYSREAEATFSKKFTGLEELKEWYIETFPKAKGKKKAERIFSELQERTSSTGYLKG